MALICNKVKNINTLLKSKLSGYIQSVQSPDLYKKLDFKTTLNLLQNLKEIEYTSNPAFYALEDNLVDKANHNIDKNTLMDAFHFCVMNKTPNSKIGILVV